MLLQPLIFPNIQWLLEVVDAALSHHGVRPSEIRVCLVFGSLARGDANHESDVDLIHLARDSGDVPASLEYRRFTHNGRNVDSNLIPFERLNAYCGDPHWAYRLCMARALAERSNDPVEDIVAWLARVQAMITSRAACLHRARAHIDSLTALAGILPISGGTDSRLRCYVISEVIELVSISAVELCGVVPFQTARPEDLIRGGLLEAQCELRRAFNELVGAVEDAEMCGGTFRRFAWPTETTRVRRQCRQIIEMGWPESFGEGYKFLLSVNGLTLRAIEHHLCRHKAPGCAPAFRLEEALRRYLEAARSALQEGKLSSRATFRPTERQREAQPGGARLVEYSGSERRAKVIVPTGGCRVATCSFCMLPQLARTKIAVRDVLAKFREAINGPVERVAIYTDGSFFDDRELAADERRLIASTAVRRGANEVLVESLPRFLEEATVREIMDILGPRCRLRIGVGLQSTDGEVRRYITRTPILDSEFEELLRLQRCLRFSLRIYLLSGKCMMSFEEDLEDVERSVIELNNVLLGSDLITVNPLLPTIGTLVERLQQADYFEPMSVCTARLVAKRLRSRPLRLALEFGSIETSSCTPLAWNVRRGKGYGWCAEWMYGKCELGRCQQEEEQPLVACMLPWSLLGSLPTRRRWADSLELDAVPVGHS